MAGINEYLLRGIFTKPMQIELESLEDKLKQLPMPSSTGLGIPNKDTAMISYCPNKPLQSKGQRFVRLILLPFRVLQICYSLVRHVVKEVMQTPSTVVVSALTKGISFSTTSYRDQQRRSPKDGW